MKKIKRSLSMILVIVLTLTLCLPIVNAEDNGIKVMLNGQYVEFDVQTQLVNGRTMVPFRAIFEAMGANVSWNQELWQATGEKNDKKVTMTIDSTDVIVTKGGEEKVVTIDQAPIVVEGRTMVPVRFVAQAFDKIVSWDNESKTVIIFDLEYFVDKIAQKAPNFYECITSVKGIPETFKAKDTVDLSVTGKSETMDVTLRVDGQIDSVVNKTNAYMGIEADMLVKAGDKKQTINVDADMYFKDNYVVIKSNVAELMGSDEIEYEGKVYSIKQDGIYFDLAQLGIPGINTFEDFMRIYTENDSIDSASNMINEAIYNQDITVKEATDIIAMYDLMLDLVSNDKFTKSTNSTTTIYTWNLNKKDIISLITNIYTSGMINAEEIDLEELSELNDIYKDFNMVTKLYVKDNMPIKSMFDIDMKIGNEDVEITMDLKYNEELTSINKGPFTIKHPSIEKALDLYKYFETQNNKSLYAEAEEVFAYGMNMVQDEINLKMTNNLAEGKDKFDSIIPYTVDTFPVEGVTIDNQIVIAILDNFNNDGANYAGDVGIDKEGTIYFIPGVYFEKDDVTKYNDNYFVEGKIEGAIDLIEVLYY